LNDETWPDGLDTRLTWARHALADLQAEFQERTLDILLALREEADDFARTYTETMLREQRARHPSERGTIGLRTRSTAAGGPGIFQIEWYRVHAKRRTLYLKRGKGQDGRVSQQYPMSSFGRLTGWEKDLVQVYEPQFARLRTIQSHISHIRMRFRLISEEFDRNRGAKEHDASSDAPDEWTR
jgi:hypothetical protein